MNNSKQNSNAKQNSNSKQNSKTNDLLLNSRSLNSIFTKYYYSHLHDVDEKLPFVVAYEYAYKDNELII